MKMGLSMNSENTSSSDRAGNQTTTISGIRLSVCLFFLFCFILAGQLVGLGGEPPLPRTGMIRGMDEVARKGRHVPGSWNGSDGCAGSRLIPLRKWNSFPVCHYTRSDRLARRRRRQTLLQSTPSPRRRFVVSSSRRPSLARRRGFDAESGHIRDPTAALSSDSTNDDKKHIKGRGGICSKTKECIVQHRSTGWERLIGLLAKDGDPAIDGDDIDSRHHRRHRRPQAAIPQNVSSQNPGYGPKNCLTDDPSDWPGMPGRRVFLSLPLYCSPLHPVISLSLSLLGIQKRIGDILRMCHISPFFTFFFKFFLW